MRAVHVLYVAVVVAAASAMGSTIAKAEWGYWHYGHHGYWDHDYWRHRWWHHHWWGTTGVGGAPAGLLPAASLLLCSPNVLLFPTSNLLRTAILLVRDDRTLGNWHLRGLPACRCS